MIGVCIGVFPWAGVGPRYIREALICLGTVGTFKGVSVHLGGLQYVWRHLKCHHIVTGLSKRLLCNMHYGHQETLQVVL